MQFSAALVIELSYIEYIIITKQSFFIEEYTMNNQLESIRDIWMNAFFIGNYEVLRQYESDDFKVVYEQEGRVESNYTRYDRIAHAVNNGVWKPQKLNIEFEEYDYDRELTQCVVLIGMEDQQQNIREIWHDIEGWKITELRFLKGKSQVL